MAEEQPTRLATLGDLKCSTVNVIVTLADGEEVAIPMRTLTYMEYNTIRWSVPDPTPVPMGADKQGRPIYDYNNVDYLRQVNETATLRNYKLLLAALRMDIPGDNEAERVTYLQNEVDATIIRQLFVIVNATAANGSARLASRAETFPERSAAGGSDAGAG